MHSNTTIVKTRKESDIIANIHQNCLECDICHERFWIKSKLLKHYEKHELTDSFSCNICSVTFYEKSSLDKHYLVHQEVINTYNCDKCGKKFLEKCQLDRHVFCFHESYSIICNEGNYKAPLKKCDRSVSEVKTSSKRERSYKKKHSDVKNNIDDVKHKRNTKLYNNIQSFSDYKDKNCHELSNIHLSEMNENPKLESENRVTSVSSIITAELCTSENVFKKKCNSHSCKSFAILINKLPHYMYKECVEKGFISLKNYPEYAELNSTAKVNIASECNSTLNFESSNHIKHEISSNILSSIKPPSSVKSKKTNCKTNLKPKKTNEAKFRQSIGNLKENTTKMNTKQNSCIHNSIQNKQKINNSPNPSYTVVQGCPNKIMYVGPKQSMHLVDHIGNLEKILKRKILYGFINTSTRPSVNLIGTNAATIKSKIILKNVQLPTPKESVATIKNDNGKSEKSSQSIENNNSVLTSVDMSSVTNITGKSKGNCPQYLIFDKNYAPGSISLVTLPQSEEKNDSHNESSPGIHNINRTNLVTSGKTSVTNPNKDKESEKDANSSTSNQSAVDAGTSEATLNDMIFVPMTPEFLRRIQGKTNIDIPKVLQEMGYVPTVKKVSNINTLPITPELLSKVQGKSCHDVPKMLKDIGFVAEVKNIFDVNEFTTKSPSVQSSANVISAKCNGKSTETTGSSKEIDSLQTSECANTLSTKLCSVENISSRKEIDSLKTLQSETLLDEFKRKSRKRFEKRKQVEKEKILKKLLIKLAEKEEKKRKKYREKKRRRLAEKQLSKCSSDSAVCVMEMETNIKGRESSHEIQSGNLEEKKNKQCFEHQIHEKDMQKMQNNSKESICDMKQQICMKERQHLLEMEKSCSKSMKKLERKKEKKQAYNFKKRILQKRACSDLNQVKRGKHSDKKKFHKLGELKFNKRKINFTICSRKKKKHKDICESAQDIGPMENEIDILNVNMNSEQKICFQGSFSEQLKMVQNEIVSEESAHQVTRKDLDDTSINKKSINKKKSHDSKEAQDCVEDPFSDKSLVTNETFTISCPCNTKDCDMFDGSSHKTVWSSDISLKIIHDVHESGVNTNSDQNIHNRNTQNNECTELRQSIVGKLQIDDKSEKNDVSMQKSLDDKLHTGKSKNTQKLPKSLNENSASSEDRQKGSSIKTEAERKVLKKFSEIDRRIKRFLNVSNINVNECLDAMSELDNLSISSGIWKESLIILKTLKKCRKFKKSEIIRHRATELYHKFIKFYMIPAAPVVNISS